MQPNFSYLNKSAYIEIHNILGISDTNNYINLYYIIMNYNIINKYTNRNSIVC